MKSETKKWFAETKNVSKINGLNFFANKTWQLCNITVKNTKGKSKFKIIVAIDDTIHTEKFILKNGASKLLTYKVYENATISVTGKLSKSLFDVSKAGGTVTVECTYNPSEVFRSKSVQWQDKTNGNSLIENLFLTDEKWERCEIKIVGHKNKNTGCFVNLLANGELRKTPKGLPHKIILNGADTKIFTFHLDDIQEKVPLVVTGYIFNNIVVAGGGLTITLTGIYR